MENYLIEINVYGQIYHKHLVKDEEDLRILDEVLDKIKRNATKFVGELNNPKQP